MVGGGGGGGLLSLCASKAYIMLFETIGKGVRTCVSKVIESLRSCPTSISERVSL